MRLLRSLNALKFLAGDEYVPIVSGTVPASIVSDVFESLMTGTSQAPIVGEYFIACADFRLSPWSLRNIYFTLMFWLPVTVDHLAVIKPTSYMSPAAVI